MPDLVGRPVRRHARPGRVACQLRSRSIGGDASAAHVDATPGRYGARPRRTTFRNHIVRRRRVPCACVHTAHDFRHSLKPRSERQRGRRRWRLCEQGNSLKEASGQRLPMRGSMLPRIRGYPSVSRLQRGFHRPLHPPGIRSKSRLAVARFQGSARGGTARLLAGSQASALRARGMYL